MRFPGSTVPEVNLKPIPQDEQRVNIFDEAEAKYWAKRFGCTRAQLEAAVRKVLRVFVLLMDYETPT